MNIMEHSSCPSPTGIDRFKQWFSFNGGQLHNCADLIETEDEGYTLRVRPGEDIKEDEMIVSCPITLAFSFVSYAEKDMAGHRSKLDSTSLSQDVVVRLYLMEQYLLGAKSFWWPYINILPQPYVPRTTAKPPGEAASIAVGKQLFHTPLYFDEEDLLWVKGTNLGAAVDSRASDWREEFENAKGFIVCIDESERALWTSDLYIWAATVFTTRSFSASALRIPDVDSPVLIPGIDLLNHSPNAKVTWSWGQATCSVTTNKTLFAGDEIFNNYGAKSNEELLMGYGFCLEHNPADSFNLSYAPALSQHIKDAKARRDVSGQSGMDPKMQTASTDVINGKFPLSADPDHDSGKDVKFVSIADGEYHFCPGFLADCSLALQNRRERQQELVCSSSITTFSNDTLSRNKLHTISSIIMILQQKQMEIRKHDKELPPTPKNHNQLYASIYRSSQLKILEGVLQGLSSTMHSIAQLRLRELPQIVRLEAILQGTPKDLKRHLREVIHAGVRTREPSKIAERGGVKFAFAMWLCGLRLLHESGDLAKNDPALSQWVDFMCRHYNHQPIEELTRDGQNKDTSDSKAREMAATVRSYGNAIRIAVEKHSGSLYRDDWAQDEANLLWCLVVVKEEGVRCPTVTEQGILGEEKDEFVVVVDAEDT